MKKRIKLTEEGLIKIIRTIVEQVNLDDYDDSDFVDVFIITFRKWLSEQIGDDIKKYPMSLLVKKFGKKFIKDYIYDGEEVRDIELDDDYALSLSAWDFINYGKKIVEKNKYQLPSLYKEEKFTEKYAKSLERIVENIGLPPYATIEFNEDQPYRVSFTVIIDFPQMLKDSEKLESGKYDWQRSLEHYIKNFLGVDFGNPSHGELNLSFRDTEYKGAQDWIKNVLNKSLKKEIKNLPDVADNVSRMGFELGENKGVLKLYFKDRYSWTGKSSRYQIKDSVKKFLSNKGYGPNLTVDV